MQSAELIIYGAAYGPEDVTAKVRSFRKDQKLDFTVSYHIFGGDPWPGIAKTFVVVYRYAACEVNTQIYVEGQQCLINPPPQSSSAPIAKGRFDSSNLEAIQQATSKQTENSDMKLVILGAVYGNKNVTQLANGKLSANGEFDQYASDEIWGDGWPGINKTLVVVYEYDGLQMLDVVKQNEHIHFIASPPMTILGAAYGLADVTTKVSALVKNRSLRVTANSDTFKDSWPGVYKTLVINYQYGQQMPMVKTVKQNGILEIIYDNTDVFTGSTNPDLLTILGAAYGPSILLSQRKPKVLLDTIKCRQKLTMMCLVLTLGLV